MERKGTAGSWELARRAQARFEQAADDMRMARDARAEALWALKQQGAGPVAIARELGVDESTVRAAIRVYESL